MNTLKQNQNPCTKDNLERPPMKNDDVYQKQVDSLFDREFWIAMIKRIYEQFNL